MPLKTENDQWVKDATTGFPVWVDASGQESPLDIEKLFGSLATTRTEAADRRRKAEGLEAQLASYKEGDALLDPAAARDAMAKLASWDAKRRSDAEGVEANFKERLATARKEEQLKYAPIETERNLLKDQVQELTVGSAFQAAAKFLKEKTTFPTPASARALVGKHFKVVTKPDGTLGTEAEYDNLPITSTITNDPATVEEAIMYILGKRPDGPEYIRQVVPDGTGGDNIKPRTELPLTGVPTPAALGAMSMDDFTKHRAAVAAIK